MIKQISKHFPNPSPEQRAARKALKDSGQLPEPPFPWVAMTVVFSALITAALFSWGVI